MAPSLQSQHYHIPLDQTFTKCNMQTERALSCDIEKDLLLNSNYFFSYFMLVAFEGGSILRACFLLSCYPLLVILNHELRLRLMILITLCGMKVKDVELVSRTVLVKFYLENLSLEVYELVFGSMKEARKKVSVLTSVPRVMVEGFCKEYLSVDEVVGTELHCVGGYFSGLVAASGVTVKHQVVIEPSGDERKEDIEAEARVMNDEDTESNSSRTKMPRESYPKPLIFHDGRLAFLPTPLAMLAIILWIPFGILLALIRIFVNVFLPYKVIMFVNALTGIHLRVKGYGELKEKKIEEVRGVGGVLFVCTHRTLLDPVVLTLTMGKSLTAVTYSLSKISEIISPIKTIRLSRNRKKDGEMIHQLLSEGDLVVCPEGTTCREPYLLRFSSLFAEITDEIVPVALDTNVTMFYGTTASGLKWLDPIYFLMNPRPIYHVQVLEKLAKGFTCGLGKKSSHEVANHIQKQLAHALGFECTKLTRRDKYSILVGNHGVVDAGSKKTKEPF